VPLSERTKLSLAQFLDPQRPDLLDVLFRKHGLYFAPSSSQHLSELAYVTTVAPADHVLAVLEEVLHTFGDFRSRVNQKSVFDLRFRDLERCLTLDGYRCNPFPYHNPISYTLVPIEPNIEGTVVVEDDLTSALNKSGLSKAEAIKSRLADSAGAFRGQPPDFNACLTNARVALEELAIAIATAVGPPPANGFYWGNALTAIRQANYITLDHEKGLAGVYTFISHGAHKHMALTDEEMARLGRNLAISMCYFLVRVCAG
jgi:hypothetical protein